MGFGGVQTWCANGFQKHRDPNDCPETRSFIFKRRAVLTAVTMVRYTIIDDSSNIGDLNESLISRL